MISAGFYPTPVTSARGAKGSAVVRRGFGSRRAAEEGDLALVSGLAEQLLESADVHRLDQVVIDSRFTGSQPILLLPPTGQRDEHHVLSLGLLADTPGDLVPVHPGHT